MRVTVRIDGEVQKAFEDTPWVLVRPGWREKKAIIAGMILEDSEGFCQDCLVMWPATFCVHDELWEKYVPENGIICISCLGKRMGRKVTVEDLKDVGAHEVLFHVLDIPLIPRIYTMKNITRELEGKDGIKYGAQTDGHVCWVNGPERIVGRFSMTLSEVSIPADGAGRLSRNKATILKGTRIAGWREFQQDLLESYGITLPDEFAPHQIANVLSRVEV